MTDIRISKLLRPFLVSLTALGCLVVSQGASATSFTLSLSNAAASAENPLTPLGGTLAVGTGQTFTIVLGLDDVDEIFSYTLDIQIDTSELAFVGATQLACAATGPGACAAPAFSIDPATGLAGGSSGRASVLGAAVLFLDGRRNVPPGTDGPAGMLALTFSVLGGLTNDGQADVTIGFLNQAVDGITGRDLFGDPFAVLPTPDTISMSVIPEPSTLALAGFGLIGLAMNRRGTRRRSG